jgi:hypothetical protein
MPTTWSFFQILQQVFHLLKPGNFVVFCWGTWPQKCFRDEAAAKEATVLGDLAPDQVLGSDVCSFLHHTILLPWQNEWTRSGS